MAELLCLPLRWCGCGKPLSEHIRSKGDRKWSTPRRGERFLGSEADARATLAKA